MKGTIKFLNDWTQTLAGDLVQGNAAKTIAGFELPIRQATLKLRIEAAGCDSTQVLACEFRH